MKTTLYNITKSEAEILFQHCDNSIEKLALVLWNAGKAETLESGIEKAKRIKNFIEKE